MAKLVTMARVTEAIGNRPTRFTVTVTNNDASAVTLSSLYVAERTQMGAQIGQPQYLTPNVPVGTGNPTINASSSVTYGFQVVFPSPNFPGSSPNNAPGGAIPSNNAIPAANPISTLEVVAQTSDGSVFSYVLPVPVLSAVAPFPTPEGGALQLNQGANLMTLALMGAL